MTPKKREEALEKIPLRRFGKVGEVRPRCGVPCAQQVRQQLCHNTRRRPYCCSELLLIPLSPFDIPFPYRLFRYADATQL